MNVRFCPSCRSLILSDFRYCPYCGAAVSKGPDSRGGALRSIREDRRGRAVRAHARGRSHGRAEHIRESGGEPGSPRSGYGSYPPGIGKAGTTLVLIPGPTEDGIMYERLKIELKTKLADIRAEGLYKDERIIATPQGARVRVVDGKEALNFCANNYLGLANDPSIEGRGPKPWRSGATGWRACALSAARRAPIKSSSARWPISSEPRTRFSSRRASTPTAAVFEPLLDEDCAVITDSLNHASIIDGIRLCKAERWIYKHGDMRDVEELDPETGKAAKGLERCLKEAANRGSADSHGRSLLDGRGYRRLEPICDLAERYDALVMVDDSHATGFVGKTGRGSREYCGVVGRVDIITTTFGKALGGASGGCVAAPRGDRRVPAAEGQALSLLEHSGAIRSSAARCVPSRFSLVDGPARQARGEYQPLPGRDDRGGLRPQARRPSDMPRDALRREARPSHGFRASGGRGVCDRLLLSRRAARQGTYPRAAIGGPFRGKRGFRPCRLRARRSEAGDSIRGDDYTPMEHIQYIIDT